MASTKGKGYSAYALRPYSCWMPFEFEALPDFLKSIELHGYLIFQNGYRAFHLHPTDQVTIEKTEDIDPENRRRTRYRFNLPRSLCRNSPGHNFYREDCDPPKPYVSRNMTKESALYYNGRRIWQDRPFFAVYHSIHWRFMNSDMPREAICGHCLRKTDLDAPRQLELFL